MEQEWRTRGDEDVGGGGGVGAVGGGQYPQKEEGGECSTEIHGLVSIDGEIFKVESAVAGNQHSLLITTSGSVLSFGRNLDGQLGISSRKEAKLPTLVSGLRDDVILEVAASGDFSLAMSDAGCVFAWGNNNGGQLGKPPLDDSNASKDGVNSKIVVMKSTKRIIR